MERLELNEINVNPDPQTDNHGISKADYYVQQLNASNAKKVALCLVLGFICYHGLIHLHYGTDSCKWLLTDGRFKGNREWQPYGCMMHKYTQIDTKRCFRYLAFWGNHNHFVFIGDIRIRALYLSFLKHLQVYSDANDIEDSKSVPFRYDEPIIDLEYIDYKLKLQLNFIYAPEVSHIMIDQFNKWQNGVNLPSVIIASSTQTQFLHGNVTDQMLKNYSLSLSRLLMPIDSLARNKVKVLWKLQDPVNEEKLSEEWKNVQNMIIDKYNDEVYTILKYSGVQIWSSSRSISEGLIDEAVDGWQLSKLAAQHDIQILLNMYCNDNMNYNDGSCCSSAEPYTVLQIITYAAFGISVSLTVAILGRRWYLQLRGIIFYAPLNQQTNSDGILTNELSPALVATSTLAIIMGYFYLCDRTNFFMKENKYYSEFSFWIPVGYVFVLGLFFTDDSRYTKFLHRDQTDEFKGWMQVVILIYHLTGADRITPIYMLIKVLISAYLFLSGYGHFSYMWYTGNAGLTRFLQVIFRLNFMTIVLCLCMNRPYQFYYFVPLISFWYVIIYFVMALPPQITAANTENNPYKYFYLVLKCVGLFVVITVFYMSEVFFERIFVTRPWKALFVTTDDDIHEWWYRWKLDRYTITYGMIFAAIFHIAQKYKLIDDNTPQNLLSGRLLVLATFLSVCGIGFYSSFALLCQNKLDCDEIHSYVVFVPVIGYIVLRNVWGIFRTRYSSFFAWFGQISLELFICQYHIWLAADRNGVLVLLPGFPNLNILISLYIFVCASHEVHRLTQVLLPYAVPNDWKIALRNLVIFLIVLIPIGKYDGMF